MKFWRESNAISDLCYEQCGTTRFQCESLCQHLGAVQCFYHLAILKVIDYLYDTKSKGKKDKSVPLKHRPPSIRELQTAQYRMQRGGYGYETPLKKNSIAWRYINLLRK
jgi:hypothetical protein